MRLFKITACTTIAIAALTACSQDEKNQNPKTASQNTDIENTQESEPRKLTSQQIVLFDGSHKEFFKIAPAGGANKELTPSNATKFKEKTTLIGNDFWEIDVDSSYFGRIKVKFADQKIDDFRKSGLIVGFATYDKNRTLETSAPGTHRYFLLPANATPTSINENGDIVFQGEISGAGNKPSEFRPTTRFIKPYILVNQTGTIETEIVSFTFGKSE